MHKLTTHCYKALGVLFYVVSMHPIENTGVHINYIKQYTQFLKKLNVCQILVVKTLIVSDYVGDLRDAL